MSRDSLKLLRGSQDMLSSLLFPVGTYHILSFYCSTYTLHQSIYLANLEKAPYGGKQYAGLWKTAMYKTPSFSLRNIWSTDNGM